jgi:hypothetical protein
MRAVVSIKAHTETKRVLHDDEALLFRGRAGRTALTFSAAERIERVSVFRLLGRRRFRHVVIRAELVLNIDRRVLEQLDHFRSR